MRVNYVAACLAAFAAADPEDSRNSNWVNNKLDDINEDLDKIATKIAGIDDLIDDI